MTLYVGRFYMPDQQDKRHSEKVRRGADRRITEDADFKGPERRKGERRLHERRSD